MAGILADEQAGGGVAHEQPPVPRQLGIELAALRRQRQRAHPVSRAQRGVAVIDRQLEIEPAAFDPERLRDAQGEAVIVLEHAVAREVQRPCAARQARAAGDRSAAARVSPPVAQRRAEPPVAGELPARAGIDKQRVGARQPERIVELGAEHGRVLAHPVEPERGAEIAEAAIEREAEIADPAAVALPAQLRRAMHIGGAPGLAAVGAERQAPWAELPPHGKRGVGGAIEPGIADRSSGDHERRAILALQLRYQPVAALGKAERDPGVRRQLQRDAAGEHTGLLGVFAAQAEQAGERHFAALSAGVDGESDRRLVAARGDVALPRADRAVQRLADDRAAQRRREIDPEGALVFVEHDGLQRGVCGRIAHRRRCHPAAVRQGQRGRAAGQAGGADRLEGVSEVENAAAVSRVGPCRAGIERRAQQDVGDLLAGQVRERLRQQCRGAGDLGRGEAGPGDQVDEPLVVDEQLAVLVLAANPLAPR